MHARIPGIGFVCPNKSIPGSFLGGDKVVGKQPVRRSMSFDFVLDLKVAGMKSATRQRNAHLVGRASDGSSDQALVPVKEGYMVFELVSFFKNEL